MRVCVSGVLVVLLVVAAWRVLESDTIQSIPQAAPASLTAPENPFDESQQPLLHNSQDSSIISEDDRLWFTDQPSHMVVDRVHGGITPGQGSLPVQ